MGADTKTTVDVGGLSATIANDAADRVASLITSTDLYLEEMAGPVQWPLNEVQLGAFIRNSVLFFDGFERAIAKTLVNELESHGIAIHGLPRELADLSSDEGSDDA